MSNSLTTAEFWENEFWRLGTDEVPDVVFDPWNPEFREIHTFLSAHLPRDSTLRFVELGCHPGRYIWYFHTHFGYTVSGVEYVEACCSLTGQSLARASVSAEIHHADVFTFRPPGDRRYDVVASFGLVEHFREITPIVCRHADLLNPGGWLVIIVPNHRGLNGLIFRRILPEQFALHNQMTYAHLQHAVGVDAGLDVVAGGYLGRFNLAPTNFCPWAKERFGAHAYSWIDRLHRWGMNGLRWFPNSMLWSPYLGIVARRSMQPEIDADQQNPQ